MGEWVLPTVRGGKRTLPIVRVGEWVLHLVRGGERTLPIVRVGGMSTPYSQWWEKRGTPYS